MGWVTSGNEKAQSSGEQRPGHLREGEKEQTPTAECIDSPDGRPSKNEIDETEAKRGNERFSLRGIRLSEDGT